MLYTSKLNRPCNRITASFKQGRVTSKGVTVEPQSASESIQQENVKPRNFFNRLGGVYFGPGETFKEIGWTQEQAEQQAAVMSSFGKYQLIIGSAIGNLLIALAIAGMFKLISLFVGAENRFKTVFCVTLYALIAVFVVQYIVTCIILLSKSPGELSFTSLTSLVASNLGALISSLAGEDALPKYLMRLLGWIDIFAIWIIALLSVGYAAVSRKLTTSTAAVWLGGTYIVIALIGSALGGLFS
ncbi:MAG: hypothetical protein H6Q07_3311 [Acidobacteria bacterium]|nr:hypothetical protein [Acidobacteriota bacterium]